jgi:hypothetical protein
MPFSYYRTPLILLGIVIIVCLATVMAPPAGRFSWLLEVGPGLAGVAVLVPLFHRLHDRSMTRLDKFDGPHLSGRIRG